MAAGIGWRAVGTAVGCALVAVLAAGCDAEAAPREVETVPPGPDVSPSAETPSPPLPAPSVPVNAAAGCATLDQVLDALIYADPDTPPDPATTLSAPPVCAAGWAYVGVAAPRKDEARVVLRHIGGRWQVLTYGSAPCQEPRVADAPAAVRAAAGC